ncbi:hypothetical protein [Salegentibacter maritimus]|uniref:Cupin domain-containing protein n=1 Tax=Salegentibacter maritimus TaxID=2794347 RepID=A0ABS0TKC5_9FLAO|nr:hypothetical protein [Salegentibacter maritimus]MBI6121240.1 hypothetical protein [Salegentibacter maritimus]
MKNIEKYNIGKNGGFKPFFISEGWQIAQLDYTPEQNIEKLNKLDRHQHTDEAFFLLKGKVVLISAHYIDEIFEFEVELIENGNVYNIPQNTWHNIAMEEGSEVLIVEKANTHISDVQFLFLKENKIKEMKSLVKQAFCKKK